MSLILFKKINNIISYLIILDGQKNESDNLEYAKLIDDEIKFYKIKLYEYCKIYSTLLKISSFFKYCKKNIKHLKNYFLLYYIWNINLLYLWK